MVFVVGLSDIVLRVLLHGHCFLCLFGFHNGFVAMDASFLFGSDGLIFSNNFYAKLCGAVAGHVCILNFAQLHGSSGDALSLCHRVEWRDSSG